MNDRDEHALREMLIERGRDRFDEGFAERAVARWRADRDSAAALEATIVRQFRRAVPLAAAAALLLAFHNVRSRTDRDRGVVAALLGFSPPVTLDAIYPLGLTGSSAE